MFTSGRVKIRIEIDVNDENGGQSRNLVCEKDMAVGGIGTGAPQALPYRPLAEDLFNQAMADLQKQYDVKPA